MKNYKYKLVEKDHSFYDDIDDVDITGDLVLGRFNSLKKLFESFNPYWYLDDCSTNNIFSPWIELYRYGRKNKHGIRPKKLMAEKDKIKTLIREGFTDKQIEDMKFSGTMGIE